MSLDQLLAKRQALRARGQQISTSSRLLEAQLSELGGQGDEGEEGEVKTSTTAAKMTTMAAAAEVLSTSRGMHTATIRALPMCHRAAKHRLTTFAREAEAAAQARDDGGEEEVREVEDDEEARRLEEEYVSELAAAENSDEDVAVAAAAAEHAAASYCGCATTAADVVATGRPSPSDDDGFIGGRCGVFIATVAVGTVGLFALLCALAFWGASVSHATGVLSRDGARRLSAAPARAPGHDVDDSSWLLAPGVASLFPGLLPAPSGCGQVLVRLRQGVWRLFGVDVVAEGLVDVAAAAAAEDEL